MLIERRARAQERRVVPETIARFLAEAARYVPFKLAWSKTASHSPAAPAGDDRDSVQRDRQATAVSGHTRGRRSRRRGARRIPSSPTARPRCCAATSATRTGSCRRWRAGIRAAPPTARRRRSTPWNGSHRAIRCSRQCAGTRAPKRPACSARALPSTPCSTPIRPGSTSTGRASWTAWGRPSTKGSSRWRRTIGARSIFGSRASSEASCPRRRRRHCPRWRPRPNPPPGCTGTPWRRSSKTPGGSG